MRLLLTVEFFFLCYISSVLGFVPCNNGSQSGHCSEGWHCCDNGWCCSDGFVCGNNSCIYLKGLSVPIGIVLISLVIGSFFCLHHIRKKKKRFQLSSRIKDDSEDDRNQEDVIVEQF